MFDTAVFHFELSYDNKGFVEHQKALESRYIYNSDNILKFSKFRKESSMPIRAGVFFEMFPFCLLFEVGQTLLSFKYYPLIFSLERHDCEEYGYSSPFLHSTNGGKKDGRVLGTYQTFG